MLEDNNFWERVETIMAEVAIIKLAVRWEECEHWSSTNGETCFPHKVNQAPLAYTISQKKTSWNNKTTWGLPLHSLMGKDPTERRELLWPSPILLWPFSCCPPRIPSLFWYLISTPNSNPAPPASDRSKTWLYLDYSSTFFSWKDISPLVPQTWRICFLSFEPSEFSFIASLETWLEELKLLPFCHWSYRAPDIRAVWCRKTICHGTLRFPFLRTSNQSASSFGTLYI